MRNDSAREDTRPERAPRGPVRRARRLDAVDRGIIEALQRNGREAFRRIAVTLGVSEATIRARYRRLCDDGIEHWADPRMRRSGEINNEHGGRGVYFKDPAGHAIELITRPYL